MLPYSRNSYCYSNNCRIIWLGYDPRYTFLFLRSYNISRIKYLELFVLLICFGSFNLELYSKDSTHTYQLKRGYAYEHR
jgi:hypothetical protein